jgi:N-acetylmuramoyl-L-alanine amidase
MWVISQQNPKNIMLSYKLFLLISFFSVGFIPLNHLYAQDKVFTVVLDAGHGGKDTGTTGTKRYKDKNEKDIVLAVALKVGNLLVKQIPDIKVIFTRKTDKFIELNKRGEIANKANADLFVSIHANAASYKANGTETYVLGVHRNATNLAVAKRENDVILLEKDYEKHYSYDPHSPASIISLTLMQEDYLDQSIRLAKIIEQSFAEVGKRHARGVKQAGFVVLHQTYMPSVLIEIGFLSNKAEEDFLRKSSGQQKIALSIVDAIKKYKTELDKNTVKTPTIKQQAKDKRIFKDVIFKVQIASSSNKVSTKSYNFKGLEDVERVKVGNFYKYYLGKTSDYNAIKTYKEKAVEKGYTSAFIVAFKGNERISVSQLLKSASK